MSVSYNNSHLLRADYTLYIQKDSKMLNQEVTEMNYDQKISREKHGNKNYCATVPKGVTHGYF